MEESVLYILIFFGGTLLFGLIFFFIWRYQAKRTALLLERASERGWKSRRIKEGRKSGYLFEGSKGGVSWSLELSRYSSPRQSSSAGSSQSEQTVWTCRETILKEGLVLIGPRIKTGIEIPDLTQMKGFMGMMARKAMERMLGEDAGLISGLKEIPMGTGILSDRYMIFAHDENAVRRVISSDTERILFNWNKKYPLFIKLYHRGIEITVKGHMIYDAEILEQMIDLGSGISSVQF